jgi:hypothetical protein
MPASSSQRAQRIRDLARRETDPRHAREFAPVTKGPVVALLALLVLGIAALPFVVAARIRVLLHRRPR